MPDVRRGYRYQEGYEIRDTRFYGSMVVNIYHGVVVNDGFRYKENKAKFLIYCSLQVDRLLVDIELRLVDEQQRSACFELLLMIVRMIYRWLDQGYRTWYLFPLPGRCNILTLCIFMIYG